MTLYLFHGQEDFLIEKDIEKLKNKLLDKNFLAMNFKSYSNPNFMTLTDILNTQPMMFGKSLIIIEINKIIEAKTESGLSENQLEQLENSLKNVSENLNIIFLYKTERNENKKIDTRRKLYKILSKYCEIKDFPQYPTYSKELPPIITKLGKDNGLEISKQCADKIIQTIGNNLRAVDNELKKLKLLIHPNTSPTIQNVDEICTVSQDIFKLADYFITQNCDKAMREFELLKQNQHPLQILAMLQNTISRFINLKLLSRDLGPTEISREIGMHEYRVKLDLEKIKNYKYDELLEIRKRLVDAEHKIKTGKTQSEEIALEQALMGRS